MQPSSSATNATVHLIAIVCFNSSCLVMSTVPNTSVPTGSLLAQDMIRVLTPKNMTISATTDNNVNNKHYLSTVNIFHNDENLYPTVEDVYNITSDKDNRPTMILDFWPWQLLLIILYTFTAFLSLTLNIITICVWLKGDRSISTELWKFLVNLSVADIGIAIFCIPFTYTNVMLQQWIFPHCLCPIVNFAQQCFVFVSVWTLTIIGIDRYDTITLRLLFLFQKLFAFLNNNIHLKCAVQQNSRATQYILNQS